jgi:hypothetical protein
LAWIREAIMVDLKNLLYSREYANQFWALTLLLAIRDRAREMRFDPHEDAKSLTYNVEGQEQVLVPPPSHASRDLIEGIQALSRPRGLLPILARVLRRFANWLEGPQSVFAARVGGRFVGISVSKPYPFGVREAVELHFTINESASMKAGKVLNDYFASRRFNVES